MAHLIDKDALVAEIERLEKVNQEYKKTWKWKIKWFYRTIIGRLEVLEGLKAFVDTLEVKEVDLEKETKKWWKERLHLNPENQLWMDAHQSIVFAKHFFELGLKAQKGE